MKCKMQYSYEIKKDHRLRFWISFYSLFQLLKRRKQTKGLCQISYWICKAFAILVKLMTRLFFCLCKILQVAFRKATARKKSLCGCRRIWHGQILQCYSRQIGKPPRLFFTERQWVNFSIELSLVQYIQVFLNLPFQFVN
jgi:hypothetical protein